MHRQRRLFRCCEFAREAVRFRAGRTGVGRIDDEVGTGSKEGAGAGGSDVLRDFRDERRFSREVDWDYERR